MRPHLRYAMVVARHKWYVLVAGTRLRVPLRRLLAHDASKMSRAEWPHYARRFGARPEGPKTPEFSRATEHHYRANDHHWQHWVLRSVDDEYRDRNAMRMPEVAAREMVADWSAAGRAYSGAWDAPAWYGRNRTRIALHPATRDLVERMLREMDH